MLLCSGISFSQRAPVSIEVDASRPIGDMKTFWSFFGYDEPNYTYRENGKKLLTNASHVYETMIPNANHFIPWSKFDEIRAVLLKLY